MATCFIYSLEDSPPLFGGEFLVKLTLPSILLANLPSFFYTLLLSFLYFGLVGATADKIVKVSLTIFVLATVTEIFSSYLSFINVRFDWWDITFSALASIIFIAISSKYIVNSKTIPSAPSKNKLGFLLVLIVAVSTNIASSIDKTDIITYEPKYMTYTELRSSVTMVERSEPKKVGKIYIYQDYILINEPYKGIHIYLAENLTHLAFIKIPGNIDIAVRDDILYADSFIDFIAVQLSTDKTQIQVLKRYTDVFPYDEYSVIDNPEVSFGSLDKTKGVVIGYRKDKKTIHNFTSLFHEVTYED